MPIRFSCALDHVTNTMADVAMFQGGRESHSLLVLAASFFDGFTWHVTKFTIISYCILGSYNHVMFCISVKFG